MAHEEVLARSDFFADVPLEQLSDLAAKGKIQPLTRGDILFQQGADSIELFVVLDGRIAMTNRSTDGRESVVALMEPGDLFGEMPFLDNGQRSAEARALESSSVLCISYEPVRDLFNNQPELLWGVVRLLSHRLRSTDEALADAMFLDVTGRTAKRLLELGDGADEFTLPITQEELAGMVGASRERVNKAIASFIRLGWLEQQERRYKVVKRDRLELRAR
jgi:CRP/FNR family transcriptional regulator, cyclic AMP receptor protein